MSTDLLQDEPVQPQYLAPHIQLREVQAFKRVCHTCCDPKECLAAAPNEPAEDEQLPHCPRRI